MRKSASRATELPAMAASQYFRLAWAQQPTSMHGFFRDLRGS
jgi:hypothetical protein